jgi:hypothetical protein
MHRQNQLRIEEFLDFLLAPAYKTEPSDDAAKTREGLRLLNEIAKWPPDVFAVAASLLRRSGSYTRLREVPFRTDLSDEDFRNWRNQEPPGKVLDRLKEIWNRRSTGVAQCASDVVLLKALHHLLADADQVCQRGPVGTEVDSSSEVRFQFDFETQLQPREFGSTLCRYIHPSRARVLPKTHTARAGLTLRSFSHHLCYVEPDEIKPLWYTIPGGRNYELERLKILVVPFPESINNLQFTETTASRLDREGMGEHRFFRYEPGFTCGRLAAQVLDLCAEAKERAGPIDLVVLPELAMNAADYRLLRQVLLSQQIMLVTGLGGRTQEGLNENRIAWDIPLSSTHAVHLRQRKHHRWNIERSQIKQYELGSQFAPARTYWEDIDLGDRHLCFVALRPWLLASVLICEDLARHEPVGELVRGVGPNLVIALLMDGPQTEKRWSSRYASVLADDPGTSVLSITSRGMSKKSKPLPGYDDESDIVGLWKDTRQTVKLQLKGDAEALLLCVNIEPEVEWTADLRKESASHFPFLSDVIQIKCNAGKTWPASVSHFMTTPTMFISPYEASVLARMALLAGSLRQHYDKALAEVSRDLLRLVYPHALNDLDEEARKIAESLLLLSEPWKEPPRKDGDEENEENKQRAEFNALGLDWAPSARRDPDVERTAKAIQRWCRGNAKHWQAASSFDDWSGAKPKYSAKQTRA